MPAVVSEAISNAGLSVSDVDWLLLHQANIRIMEHAAEVLGISMDKVLRNIEVCMYVWRARHSCCPTHLTRIVSCIVVWGSEL